MYIVDTFDEQFMFLPKSTFEDNLTDGLIDMVITRSDTTAELDAKIEVLTLGENYNVFVFTVVDNEVDEEPENAVYYMQEGEYEFNIMNRRILVRVDTTSKNYY